MWRLGVEAILGLCCHEGGLRLDPCIPPEWPGFEATVRLGGREYHVVVDNSRGTGRGIESITVDGVALQSPLVKLGPGASRREVRVVLGTAAKAAE